VSNSKHNYVAAKATNHSTTALTALQVSFGEPFSSDSRSDGTDCSHCRAFRWCGEWLNGNTPVEFCLKFETSVSARKTSGEKTKKYISALTIVATYRGFRHGTSIYPSVEFLSVAAYHTQFSAGMCVTSTLRTATDGVIGISRVEDIPIFKF
jgi:hypothetical protein